VQLLFLHWSRSQLPLFVQWAKQAAAAAENNMQEQVSPFFSPEKFRIDPRVAIECS
jgi:hypothetical protein